MNKRNWVGVVLALAVVSAQAAMVGDTSGFAPLLSAARNTGAFFKSLGNIVMTAGLTFSFLWGLLSILGRKGSWLEALGTPVLVGIAATLIGAFMNYAGWTFY